MRIKVVLVVLALTAMMALSACGRSDVRSVEVDPRLASSGLAEKVDGLAASSDDGELASHHLAVIETKVGRFDALTAEQASWFDLDETYDFADKDQLLLAPDGQEFVIVELQRATAPWVDRINESTGTASVRIKVDGRTTALPAFEDQPTERVLLSAPKEYDSVHLIILDAGREVSLDLLSGKR